MIEAYYNAGLVYKENCPTWRMRSITWTELTERMDEVRFTLRPTTSCTELICNGKWRGITKAHSAQLAIGILSACRSVTRTRVGHFD